MNVLQTHGKLLFANNNSLLSISNPFETNIHSANTMLLSEVMFFKHEKNFLDTLQNSLHPANSKTKSNIPHQLPINYLHTCLHRTKTRNVSNT